MIELKDYEKALDLRLDLRFYEEGNPLSRDRNASVMAYIKRAINAEEAIRKHRDARGDDRCWQDDEILYQSLPEGYTPPLRDTWVLLEQCQQYIACQHNPATEYVSPQRRIDELELALKNLIGHVRDAADALQAYGYMYVSTGLRQVADAAQHLLHPEKSAQSATQTP